MILVGNVKMSKQDLTRSHAGFWVLSSLDRSTPAGRSTYAYPVHNGTVDHQFVAESWDMQPNG